MRNAAFLAFLFLLFLVKATPKWLLVALAVFSAFAVAQISGLFARLPVNELVALPRGLWDGNPWAWASFVLLAYVGSMFYFYRRLWIACEVRLALIERQRGNKR